MSYKNIYPLVLLLAGILLSTIPVPPTSFIDLTAMNTQVNPADDFYEYVNGNWLKNNEIPPTESTWGSFGLLKKEIKRRLQQLMTDASQKQFAAESDEAKLVSFYKSGMDTNAIEKLGWKPVKEDLERINKIQNTSELLNEVAKQHFMGLSLPMFSSGDLADPVKNDVELVIIEQGGMGLPEKNYYFKTDTNAVKIRNAYVQFMTSLLTMTGTDVVTAKQVANNILDLETTLAKNARTATENRNISKQLNYYTLDKMVKEFPSLEWNNFFTNAQINSSRIIVAQPEFFTNLNTELASTPLDTWKNYLKVRFLIEAAPHLSSNFRSAHFEFYNKTLSGQKEQKPRWEIMVANADEKMGEAFGHLYVEQYFPESAKKRINDLVTNLLETYNERILTLDWMSDSTKTTALAKLNTIHRKIAFPDKWYNYNTVAISGNYFDNIKALSQFARQRNIGRIGKPVDRDLWTMTAPTINAYYNPLNNEIVFPSGILVFPFFDKDADDAINYGAIGSVIGHEISHAFDDQGSQFDKDGRFSNWWLPTDNEKFTLKGNDLVSFYNGYNPIDTLHINGRLTLGENIGDLGGITVAYEAFQKTKQAKAGIKIDGFTPNQRFFISFAQLARTKYSDNYLRRQVLSNPHSPFKYRVIGPLSNFTPFYEAFNVKPGNKMWSDEKDRVKIW